MYLNNNYYMMKIGNLLLLSKYFATKTLLLRRYRVDEVMKVY